MASLARIGGRSLISLILLFSAALHLANPFYYLGSVYGYRLSVVEFGTAAAIFLPFLQLLIAVQLWLPASRTVGWMLASVLFIFYASVQAAALGHGLAIRCGCFGPDLSQLVSKSSLAFVASLALLSLAAWLADRPRPQGGDRLEPNHEG